MYLYRLHVSVCCSHPKFLRDGSAVHLFSGTQLRESMLILSSVLNPNVRCSKRTYSPHETNWFKPDERRSRPWLEQRHKKETRKLSFCHLNWKCFSVQSKIIIVICFLLMPARQCPNLSKCLNFRNPLHSRKWLRYCLVKIRSMNLVIQESKGSVNLIKRYRYPTKDF